MLKNFYQIPWQFIIILIFLSGILAPQAFGKTQELKTYRFGVITLTHPIVLYRQYLPFFDYINEHLPWNFELVLYKEYAEVVKAIEDGELDMALLGGNTFIQAQRHTNLKPIAAVLSQDKNTKTSAILVTKSDNDNINNIADLRGKSMAFGPAQSTSSYLMPLYYLQKNSINLLDFSRYANLGNHDAVARAVLRGDYEAGVLGEPFAKRFLNNGLKQIGATEPFPGFLLVARAGVPQNVQEAIQKLLWEINPKSQEFIEKSSAWPEILRYGFGPVNMTDYEIFKQLSNIAESF